MATSRNDSFRTTEDGARRRRRLGEDWDNYSFIQRDELTSGCDNDVVVRRNDIKNEQCKLPQLADINWGRFDVAAATAAAMVVVTVVVVVPLLLLLRERGRWRGMIYFARG